MKQEIVFLFDKIVWRYFTNKKKLAKQFEGMVLSDGQKPLEYIESYPEIDRKIVAKAIIKCMRLGYPLNDLEITRKARELNRIRFGIK